jgi:hypothetical protein
METLYTKYLTALKNILLNNGMPYKKVVTLINQQKFDDIFFINLLSEGYSETVTNLIQLIILERFKIGVNLESKLNDLLWLNNALIQFKLEPQPTKTQALKLLQKININIYDLDAELYNMQTDFKSLRKDIKKNPCRRYPLEEAKQFIALKCFLKKL